MRSGFWGLTAACLAAATSALADGEHIAWSQVKRPSAQISQAIGSYSGGCLAGAATLPLLAEGYQAMRPQRNRYYGHPKLVDFVRRLGGRAAARDARILIGDLAQPRGGPMSSGHRSHQIGLDADIWFRHIPADEQLSYRDSVNMPMREVADSKSGRMRSYWHPLYRDLLQFAAESPEVARVFVNPVIKQHLCRDPQNHRWLRKIRAWWGHDAHFHVRLHCPVDSPLCRPQESIPAGSGCGAALDRWVQDLKNPKPRRWRAPKPIILPNSCQAVLRAKS